MRRESNGYPRNRKDQPQADCYTASAAECSATIQYGNAAYVLEASLVATVSASTEERLPSDTLEELEQELAEWEHDLLLGD
jgi:hypothetical protein